MSDLLDAVLTWLHGALTTNLQLKSVALAFSIGLFVYLHGQENTHLRTVDVDVSVLLPREKEKRVLMTQMPPSVRVTLRGPLRLLDEMTQQRLGAVELDLRDGEQRVVEVNLDKIALPPGVEVTQIEPQSIQVQWQDQITREVKLQAAITGKPADGFIVKGEPRVTPRTIRIEGPRNVLETMQFARVAAFDVTGKKAGAYKQPLAVDAPPNRCTYLGPPRAEVEVTIERVEAIQRFEVPVQVVGVPGASATPRLVTVTVRGSPDVVRALKKEQIVPRADITGPATDTSHGSMTVSLKVDLSEAQASVQPPSVTVTW